MERVGGGEVGWVGEGGFVGGDCAGVFVGNLSDGSHYVGWKVFRGCIIGGF